VSRPWAKFSNRYLTCADERSPLDRHQSGNVLYGVTAITRPALRRFVMALSVNQTTPNGRH
jgi:hypothetical protein